MHWRDEYLLGIQEIDNQHKTLIGLFDAIEEAVKQGKNWTTTYFHIAELRDYARFHFACEEALMRVFNFADITLHAAEHAHFLKFLSEMENSSLRKSMENDLVRQLRSWVTKHIVGSDRDFSRHVLSGTAIGILTT